MRNDRNDLPHLTFSFTNPSGICSLHLTRRTLEGAEQRIDLAEFADADLLRTAIDFIQSLQNLIAAERHQLRRVRPGWLGRKGYGVVLFQNELERSFEELVFPQRRYHGKNERYFDVSRLDEYVRTIGVTTHILRPEVLHRLKYEGNATPVFAVRLIGRHRPSIIPLLVLPTGNRTLAWFDVNTLIPKLFATIEGYFVKAIRQIIPPGTWSRIHSEMDLEELGIALEP